MANHHELSNFIWQIQQQHAQAELYVYGQDYHKRSFAGAASDLLIKSDAKENQKLKSVTVIH